MMQRNKQKSFREPLHKWHATMRERLIRPTFLTDLYTGWRKTTPNWHRLPWNWKNNSKSWRTRMAPWCSCSISRKCMGEHKHCNGFGYEHTSTVYWGEEVARFVLFADNLSAQESDPFKTEIASTRGGGGSIFWTEKCNECLVTCGCWRCPSAQIVHCVISPWLARSR